jgi:metal-responsive CopG/Arc/MetJ family transcriptional regulator
MRVSVSISELVSNFKEAIKKSIIVKRSEKLLKVFENRQRIHRKY